ILWIWLRQLEPCLAGKPLHSLGEAQTLDLHQEGEDVAVLSAREAVIEALLVVDRKRRRLLAVEGTSAHELAPATLERHAARDDLADRQPRPDLIEKRIGKLHRLDNGLSSGVTRPAIRHLHHYPPTWNRKGTLPLRRIEIETPSAREGVESLSARRNSAGERDG